MSEYATARAVRDAGRAVALAIVLSAAGMTVLVPVVSVAAVHAYTKWQLQSMADALERASD